MTDILKRSLAECRMPTWRGFDASAQVRISELEDYMLLTAWFRGDIAQELNETLERLDDLDKRYDALDVTWETQGKPKTDKGVEAAKYEVDPQLCASRRDAQKRVARLRAEMDRLDRDATVCSRAYTMITGT